MSANAIPERRCALTGQTAPKSSLLRLVRGPEGALVADLKQNLPGRGLYISYDRIALAKAVSSGKLAKTATRQCGETVSVDHNLPETIEQLLKQRILSGLGLERKAGRVFVGADSVEKAANGGKITVLINAADGAGDSGRFRARARAAGLPMITAFSRADLGLALGRDNVVHAALAERGAWRNLLTLVRGYEQFLGIAADTDSPAPDALGENDIGRV